MSMMIQSSQNHIAFLQSKVVPLLQGDHGHIWMKGSASKTGTNQHNMDLSKRRVKNIASVLRMHGVLDRQMQLDAVGEEEDQGHVMEDESDRAVALVVFPMARESPPPPKKVPRVSDQFKIRQLGALAGTVGPFHRDNTFFQIADPRNKVTAFYTYSGAGAGKGLIPKTPISVTLKGPWNNFRTSSPIRVSQFEGLASFDSAGGGRATINLLTIMGLPKGVNTIPGVLSINTGFTVGAGGSTSVGKMIWVPREEMIYNGD
jgi:hypothetical protein